MRCSNCDTFSPNDLSSCSAETFFLFHGRNEYGPEVPVLNPEDAYGTTTKKFLVIMLAVSVKLLMNSMYSRIWTRIKSFSCSLYATSSVRSEERRVGKECRSRWSP